MTKYKLPNQCELTEKTYWTHSFNVTDYNLGEDTQWIRLCDTCATKLGFLCNRVPEWYPKTIKESTNLKEHLLKYVENNFKQIKKTTGHYISSKTGRRILFQSMLELKHLKMMDKDPDIINFKRGPSIPYIDYYNEEHKEHIYLVDWKIYYKDGTIKIVETKLTDCISTGISGYRNIYSLIPKLDAVEKYCKKTKYIFEFWTEDCI